MCPKCGHTSAENRPSRAEFRCAACGHEDHADVNAAVNILAAGQAGLASGGGERKAPRKSLRSPVGSRAGKPELKVKAEGWQKLLDAEKREKEYFSKYLRRKIEPLFCGAEDD
jgi:hypothetical protein